MSRFRLAFGIHNHQPVGNFETVFEEAHQKAYRPFLKPLESFEGISMSLHQSGILWRWQKRAHADYYGLVKRLVDSGRLELMTGGFYEPILTSIPERDARGQIAMLNKYIADHFDKEPIGLWLTERIWEPHLPKLLAQAGVFYLPIDDTHFIYTGFEHSQLTGPFVTEHEGYRVILLPIQKRLRYLIPFGTVQDVITELRSQAERNPSGMAIYADDGEKFGVWPNTHKHCYQDGWLEEFFTALEKNADWLEVITLGQAAAETPAGRAYIPSASYEEMLHWSLPPTAFLEYENFEHWLKENEQWDRYGRFVRGGHWRSFLAKYEEANLMHKKMLMVSQRLAEYEEGAASGQNEQANLARDRLYASQCNCPYWHGVFGGLYLPHIRQAVYGSMIEADHCLRKLLGETGISARICDYDADGTDEIIIADEKLTAIFSPYRGGVLQDLALNEHAFSLTDTMTRCREGYHNKLDQAVAADSAGKTSSIHDQVLAKEEGLSRYLVEDWYLKRCFIDHFFTSGVTLEAFRSGKFGEEGDFILEPYDYRLSDDRRQLELTRQGHLWRSEEPIPIRVTKRFEFQQAGDRIVVTYTIVSSYADEVSVNFAVENNFNFQAGHTEDRFIVVDNQRASESYLDSIADYGHARTIALVDQYRSLAVAVGSEKPAQIWHAPIFTVSLSESGFEKVYQGTTVVHGYRGILSQEPFVIRLTLFAGAMDDVLVQAFAARAVSGKRV